MRFPMLNVLTPSPADLSLRPFDLEKVKVAWGFGTIGAPLLENHLNVILRTAHIPPKSGI